MVWCVRLGIRLSRAMQRRPLMLLLVTLLALLPPSMLGLPRRRVD